MLVQWESKNQKQKQSKPLMFSWLIELLMPQESFQEIAQSESNLNPNPPFQPSHPAQQLTSYVQPCYTAMVQAYFSADRMPSTRYNMLKSFPRFKSTPFTELCQRQKYKLSPQ